MVVLDASFLIAQERAEPWTDEVLAAAASAGSTLHVPAIAWTEYLAGIPHGTAPKYRRVLDRAVTFVPFDRAIADAAADLQRSLLARGDRLAWSDLQIAATAMHLGEPLASRDQDFAAVPGLEAIGP